MSGKHEICEHCGREISWSDDLRKWLHWDSAKADCGLEAEPRRRPS